MESKRDCEKKIKRIGASLKEARSALFITGAGISAESGLPTYRGVGGLYEENVTEDGVPIEVVLAAETLQSRPELTWKYLSRIEKKARGTTFNKAHKVLAELEKRLDRTWVLTQNIDGFHKEAGSKNVIDIHGDMHKLLCPSCGWSSEVKDYRGLSVPPLCQECGSIVRPEVVFFGEMLPASKLALLETELRRGFDIYFSIGTSSYFPYISRPIIAAGRMGCLTVEINPAITEVSGIVGIKVPLGASEAMTRIWQEYLNGGSKDPV